MIEQRKSPRFSVGAEIRWKRATVRDDGIAPYISHARDLSTGGVCAILGPGVAPGDTVQLEIRLSDDESIYSTGRVAWVNTQARIKGWAIAACEAGVELLNLSDYDKKIIDRFISDSFQS